MNFNQRDKRVDGGNDVQWDRAVGICFISPTFGKSLSGLGEKCAKDFSLLTHVGINVCAVSRSVMCRIE